MQKKCKTCRRLGQRCFSAKCAFTTRPFPPGQKAKKRRRGGASEYSLQLQEKQRIRYLYGLKEAQFKKYVLECLGKKKEEGQSFPDYLVEKLETRIDNVVFRLGLGKTRNLTRQLVVHGHFLVNGKRVNRPSYALKKGDAIGIKAGSIKKMPFHDLKTVLKKYETPSWLSLNKEKLEGKVLDLPKLEDVNLPIDLRIIAEYYSR